MSFASGLDCGINEMHGYDINPLAVNISKVKLTKISVNEIIETKINLRNSVFDFVKKEENLNNLPLPEVTNYRLLVFKRSGTKAKHFETLYF